MPDLSKTALSIGISIFLALFVVVSVFFLYIDPAGDACYQAYSCSAKYEFGSPERVACEADKAREASGVACSRNVEINTLIALVAAGAGLAVLGIFLSALEGIGSGILGGGILIAISGLWLTIEIWLNRYSGIAVSGIVLAILIIAGYLKFYGKPPPAQPLRYR